MSAIKPYKKTVQSVQTVQLQGASTVFGWTVCKSESVQWTELSKTSPMGKARLWTVGHFGHVAKTEVSNPKSVDTSRDWTVWTLWTVEKT